MIEKDTPAIRAHKQSIANAMAGNKAAWLSLFAEDAVIHDPVGKSPHDPTGEGFRGAQRREEFWEMMIGPQDLTIVPHKRYPCGEHVVAVAMTIVNNTPGLKIYTEMIATYEVDLEEKISLLKVYWDLDEVMAQLES